MRWTALTALILLGPVEIAVGQTSTDHSGPPKLVHTPTQLPPAKAEPEGNYAAPLPHERQGATDEDVGPVLKHFVRASKLDNLAETQVADNASLIPHEKIALDKHISVPLIHDVQNDGSARGGGENHALQFELDYLNFGAVTEEQLHARYGHYFTITWKNSGPPADFVARFEYREVKSKEIVRTLSQPMTHVSGATRSYFAVVDQAYLAYGPVVSWRFTILKADTVVAEAKSFIW
jgi:hypothetical protein